MRIFGVEIKRVRNEARQMVPSNSGWLGVMGDVFAGSWQRHVQVDGTRNMLAFSVVYACVTGIASDLAKLWVDLVEEDGEIYSKVAKSSPYWAVLKKPNGWQTWFKFFEQWIVTKLIHGNAYILKGRDQRGIVTALYVLDPQRVRVAVTPDGGIYYQLQADYLSGQQENVTVPQSEIIHDMMVSLFHPLVGVSPLFACAMSATMGNRIQSNSTLFFTNSSRPGGLLTSPAALSTAEAKELKQRWEENYSGANSGRTAVLGNGLKYEVIAIPAEQAQLIEQLKWTVEDVARCFHYPLWKLGGATPAGSKNETKQQEYYSDCLQQFVESAEQLLDDGLGLTRAGYCAVFNLENLMRMDQAAQVAAVSEMVKGAIASPNEGRKRFNLPPVPGGESPYLQQQNFSLQALAKRDALADPFSTAKPAPEPAAEPEEDEGDEPDVSAMLDKIFKGLACPK
jgi:HK97 family phage portal protein